MKVRRQAQKKFLGKGFTPPEGIEPPDILTLVMTQDVEVVVIGAHPETTVAYAVPLVKDFLHFESLLGRGHETKPHRALVGAVTGITFDLEQG